MTTLPCLLEGRTDRTANFARFLYLCGDPGIPLPGAKGASLHVESVVREFRRLGFDGEVHSVRAEAQSLLDYPLRPITLPKRRRRKSREEREARLFLAGFDAPLPAFGPPDFIYERYSLWHVGGLAAARRWDVPFVLEVNSPLPEEALEHRTLSHEPLARGVARVLFREADLVVCVSEEVAAWVVEARETREGVLVVPNGVDPDRFSPRPKSRPAPLPDDGTPLVAFSGAFRPWHGLDDLLEGFERLVTRFGSDAHLVCVGDGPMREPFQQAVKEKGLESRVHLPGRVPQEEVADWIGGANVAVAPYASDQSFYFSPLKLFEFMSLALPVVATDVGQMRDVVQPAVGRLVTPGDVDGLARAMHELLVDTDEAQNMGAAARQWILDTATWGSRVATILRALRALA